jgi:hypothetical protein
MEKFKRKKSLTDEFIDVSLSLFVLQNEDGCVAMFGCSPPFDVSTTSAPGRSFG